MEHAVVLPSNHRLTDDDVAYICETVDSFLTSRP
jgi:dTDP-4-amino-4,6-dideoxygalactose transaminase